MRSTLFITLLALHAWMVASLPVQNRIDRMESSHISLDYISSPADMVKSLPHFSEWLREERARLRTSVLEAGGKAAVAPSTWIERTEKTMRAWWAFYLTQYPAKSQATKPGSMKPSKYFTAIDTSREENETDSDSLHSEQQQQEAQATPEVDSAYMFNSLHLDPAVICSKFTPEIVGLCIFLLVPAAVMVVEVLDMLHDRWTPEQFPERGRGRVRLTGSERHSTIIAKYEREKAAQDQSRKWWGQRRRSKC